MSATIGEFLDRVARSRLLTDQQSAEIRARGEAADTSAEADDFASGIVADGLLTDFQVSRILADNYQGLIVNDYVINAHIGAGGMGEVFRAKHRTMNRDVALKLISAQALNSDGSVDRFRREVEAAAKLDHTNIVTAYDAGECNGSWYLAMQYIEGTDLTALIRECGPLSVNDAIEVIVQIARGLQAAHAKGIIHRDIKPSNVLLSDDGEAKILDMGLARFKTTEESVRPSLTRAGSIMGTAEYMAPEQAEDTHQADERSDIYSLGCTFYFLLAGRPPFQAETVVKQILQHREREIPRLSLIADDVPVAVELIFQRMLAKDPAERYQSTASLIRDLETLSPPADLPAAATSTPIGSSRLAVGDDRTLFDPDSGRNSPAPNPRGRPDSLVGVNSTIVVDGSSSSRQSPGNRGRVIAGIVLIGVLIVGTLGFLAFKNWNPPTETPVEQNQDPSPENKGAANNQDPPKPAPKKRLSDPELIEQVEKSIVRIDVQNPGSGAIGSGFVINDKGWIVTNYHVIRGATSAVLTFRDGRKVTVAGFIAVSTAYDLAIIAPATAGQEYVPLPLAKRLPKSGEDVIAFGAPKGLNWTASKGSISAVRPGTSKQMALQAGRKQIPLATLGLDPSMTWIQTTAPVSPGNSGGPLVNRDGEVVGVTTWVRISGQNLNFASWVDSVRLMTANKNLKIRPLEQIFEVAVKDAGSKPFNPAALWLPAKNRQGKEFKLVHTFRDHKGNATDIAISPKPPYLVSVGSDGKTFLYDLSKLAKVAERDEPNKSLLCVAFIANGQQVIAGADRGSSEVGDLIVRGTTDLEFSMRQLGRKGGSFVVNTSSDGRYVVTCHKEGVIDLRFLNSFNKVQVLLAHDRKKMTRDAAFSPNGRLLLTVADDGVFNVYDNQFLMPAMYSRMETELGPIYAARIAPNGRFVAAAHGDHIIRVWKNWHIPKGWVVGHQFKGHTGRIRSLAVSPDSSMIATCGDDKTLRLWNIATGKEIHRFTHDKAGFNKVLFLPNQRFLATAAQDGTVQLWRIPVENGAPAGEKQ